VQLPCLSQIKFLNFVRHGSGTTFGIGLKLLLYWWESGWYPYSRSSVPLGSPGGNWSCDIKNYTPHCPKVANSSCRQFFRWSQVFSLSFEKKNSALPITKGLLFRFNKRAIVYVQSPKWTHYNRPFLDILSVSLASGRSPSVSLVAQEVSMLDIHCVPCYL